MRAPIERLKRRRWSWVDQLDTRRAVKDSRGNQGDLESQGRHSRHPWRARHAWGHVYSEVRNQRVVRPWQGTERQTGGEVLERNPAGNEEAGPFQGALLNDDYTTMDFVIEISKLSFTRARRTLTAS